MASTIVVDKIQKTGGVPFTLPVADATVSGQSLQSDASGNLSWGSVDPIIAKGGDIASAAPTVIPDGNLYYDVTGTTGFAAFTVTAGRHFILQFDGALTMTHHATNLDLPGEDDILTVAGDVAEFVATGTNTAQCINYTRADGSPIAIANDYVTYAKIQNVSGTNKILGRDSSGAGDIEEITPANLLTMLGVETAADVTDATNVAAAGAGMLTLDQDWSGSQRATIVTDNDASFDLNLGQNFFCTVSSGTIAMTFTNIPNGQSGFIKFVNSGATMTAYSGSGATKVDTTLLATINTAGTYLISYFSDGTDVWLTTSAKYL